MLSDLAAELRAVYAEQDAERALEGLERVFANIDRVAEDARAAAQVSKHDLARGQAAGIRRRWKSVTRWRFLDRFKLDALKARGRDTLETLHVRTELAAAVGV